MILATFFGGRLSVSNANANPVTDKKPEDHLYISGGNGAHGNLSGETFNVKFDGRVRLYNGALAAKKIVVGDTSFILEPHQTYYLQGSAEKPRLQHERYFQHDLNEFNQLEGDFSILRLDKDK
jgi:hypothetical protein